jgi:hypothetical protein
MTLWFFNVDFYEILWASPWPLAPSKDARTAETYHPAITTGIMTHLNPPIIPRTKKKEKSVLRGRAVDPHLISNGHSQNKSGITVEK